MAASVISSSPPSTLLVVVVISTPSWRSHVCSPPPPTVQLRDIDPDSVTFATDVLLSTITKTRADEPKSANISLLSLFRS